VFICGMLDKIENDRRTVPRKNKVHVTLLNKKKKQTKSIK
jgi:hypothetical protein